MSMRELLRELPVLDGPLPTFDTSQAATEPMPLFGGWLRDAVAAGVAEPHAMNLATVDADGMPDTRVLILKDADDDGFQFAGEVDSAKGRQLATRPVAALGFHWREQARQVRVRGEVTMADAQLCARDFLARPVGSRAASLIGRQSTVLDDPADLDRQLRAAHQQLADDPQTVAAGHTVYLLRPAEVEFWQGDGQRRHIRLRYRRAAHGWARDLLWP